MALTLKVVSSLEKIFPNEEPAALSTPLTVLKNDQVSYQIAVYFESENAWQRRVDYTVGVNSSLGDCISVHQVALVPVRNAGYNFSDGKYISDQPGLYPDLLEPLFEDRFKAANGRWYSLWVEVTTPASIPTGKYPITITFTEPGSDETASITTEVEVIKAELPEQTLKHTEWFHCDGISQYYREPVWTERYWELLRGQIRKAVRRGINAILTPVWTPELDTRIGYERLTTQLLDIKVTESGYAFGFDRLKRWVDLCLEEHVKYFEIAHFFSQWGAKKCPKVIADVDGVPTKIFGWDTDATGDAYKGFLRAVVPALLEKFAEWGIEKHQLLFHISDEPSPEALPQYKACREIVEDLLEGYTIMDAMSDYDFFEQGVCLTPVIASNHMDPFLKGKRPEDFWIYYCISQGYEVSNRFISMPSYRTRIIGLQFYKYQVNGFLQWGYNFYNSVSSIQPIDPFATTDGDGGFPAGDPFIVYPGPDGEPWDSIRGVVFSDALHDLRALNLLESLTSREHVLSLIDDGLETPISMTQYPTDPEYLLKLMDKVHQEIKANL